MKHLKNILVILLAFILVFFDVAFFSNFQFYNATFISSFVILLIFVMISQPRNYYIYMLSTILGFAVFSSLPMIIIYLDFLVLPFLIGYLRKNFFPEPTIATSVFYFLLGTLVFEFSLLVYSASWNVDGYRAILSFMVLNTLLGVLFYSIIQRMRRDLVSAKIKL